MAAFQCFKCNLPHGKISHQAGEGDNSICDPTRIFKTDALMPSAFFQSMQFNRRILAIQGYQWGRPQWHTQSGLAICASIPEIRGGQTATGLSFLVVTARQCCIPCSI
jgi:hypothetical protein